MAANILCENEENTVLAGLFEELTAILQDSDDEQERKKIRDGLQKLTNTTSYLVLGENGVGKTSLLRMLFADILIPQDYPGSDICEYRWGEESAETPVIDGFRKNSSHPTKSKGYPLLTQED